MPFEGAGRGARAVAHLDDAEDASEAEDGESAGLEAAAAEGLVAEGDPERRDRDEVDQVERRDDEREARVVGAREAGDVLDREDDEEVAILRRELHPRQPLALDAAHMLTVSDEPVAPSLEL